MSSRLPTCIELILTIYEFLLVAEQWMFILSKYGENVSKIHKKVTLLNLTLSLNPSSEKFFKSVTPKKFIFFAIIVLFIGNIQSFSLQISTTASATKGTTSLASLQLVSKLSYSSGAFV